MTSKEAVNLFRQYRWLILTSFKDKNKALEILEELVERDTPMTPIINTNHVIREHNCGVCLCRLDIPQLKEVNFCPKCGQRLDWRKK